MRTRILGLFAVVVAILSLGGIGPVTAAGHPESAQPVGGNISMRVMSFNIHYGNDIDNELDLGLVAEDIKDSGAAIIGLQEVDRKRSARSKFVDQAVWLARKLDMHYAFGVNRVYKAPGRKKPGRFGLVVLSKYPILSSRNHMLTRVPYVNRPSKPRSVLETVIDVNGTPVSFYNTHLDNLRSSQRRLEVKEILAIAAASKRPTILVGDLNSEYPAPEIRQLRTQFTDTFAALGMDEDYTFPADDAYSRIDYIMTRGPVQVHEAEVVDDSDSSDHLPITADLTIRPLRPEHGPVAKRPWTPW